MFYKIEFDIDTFEFWSGAKDRIDNATPEQKEQVAERIEEYFDCCDDIPTDTQINDLVWFDCDDIFFPEENDEDEENEK